MWHVHCIIFSLATQHPAGRTEELQEPKTQTQVMGEVA
jgi:hypothetical protein